MVSCSFFNYFKFPLDSHVTSGCILVLHGRRNRHENGKTG